MAPPVSIFRPLVSAVLLAGALLATAPAVARLPSDAPPLPPPDPGVFTIVEVATAQELARVRLGRTGVLRCVHGPPAMDSAQKVLDREGAKS